MFPLFPATQASNGAQYQMVNSLLGIWLAQRQHQFQVQRQPLFFLSPFPVFM